MPLGADKARHCKSEMCCKRNFFQQCDFNTLILCGPTNARIRYDSNAFTLTDTKTDTDRNAHAQYDSSAYTQTDTKTDTDRQTDMQAHITIIARTYRQTQRQTQTDK